MIFRVDMLVAAAISLVSCVLFFAAALWCGLDRAEIPKSSSSVTWKPSLNSRPNLDLKPGNQADPNELLQRPIFRLPRKPFDPTQVMAATPVEATTPVLNVPPQAAPVVRPQWALKGISVVGGAGKALIVRPEILDGEWIEVGQTIDGWRLANVNGDAAIFKMNSDKLELHLYVDNDINPIGTPPSSQ